MKIAIMGAGAFGTALGGILADNGYDIDYYDPKIEKENLQTVLDGAKYVVLAAPSVSAPYLLPHLPKNIPLIVATKGMLSKNAFAEFGDLMILAGVAFADDLKAGKKSHFTITNQCLADLFTADFIEFDYTADENGVLLCGALKNAYAILAGYLNLEKDTAIWRDFINSAADEMRDILVLNEAEAKTVDLACGVGDLELTCDKPSRNYQYGQNLRDNPAAKPDKTVEGLTVLNKIKRGEIKIPESAIKLKELMGKI